jgi:hypothetical protein
MSVKEYWEKMDPETKEKRKAKLGEFRELAYAKMRQKKQIQLEKLAQYVAMNPFAGVAESCKAVGVPYNNTYRQQIRNIMAQPAMRDKVMNYKQEFINPEIMADINERYRTLALQAVEKAQIRLMAKDCKDQTLIEVLRVCGQYLAPKNAAVQINAGQGSLIGILSELPSSAQEALAQQALIEAPE